MIFAVGFSDRPIVPDKWVEHVTVALEIDDLSDNASVRRAEMDAAMIAYEMVEVSQKQPKSLFSHHAGSRRPGEMITSLRIVEEML